MWLSFPEKVAELIGVYKGRPISTETNPDVEEDTHHLCEFPQSPSWLSQLPVARLIQPSAWAEYCRTEGRQMKGQVASIENASYFGRKSSRTCCSTRSDIQSRWRSSRYS